MLINPERKAAIHVHVKVGGKATPLVKSWIMDDLIREFEGKTTLAQHR
jgi:hypothetical protein